MATKDWKKIGKDEWGRSTNNPYFDYKYKLSVIRNENYNEKWEVIKRRYVLSNYIVKWEDTKKSFKTKSQALKYAKSYMRRH